MGNTPSRDGGTPDPTGGTDCAHPAIGATDTAEVAHGRRPVHDAAQPLRLVPLGHRQHRGMRRQRGAARHASPPTAPRRRRGTWPRTCSSESTTPRFGFITPNLCNDGHDGTCAGPNSTGGNVGGLTGADQFLQAWMPLILDSPAYKHGDTAGRHHLRRGRRRRDRSDARVLQRAVRPEHPCPGQRRRPRRHRRPAAARSAPSSSTPSTSTPGSTDTTGSYNHYSALRSYEDLLGLTTGGADGEGHLGFAAAKGLAPFGTDVFPAELSGRSK